MKILIVEDEVITAQLYKMKLRKFGYEVLEPVTNGEDAIEVAKVSKPDVIIMDITLSSDLDGIETVQIISEFLDAHIIFATGYDDEETKSRASKLKQLAYFVKPVNVNKIHEILKGI